MNRNMVSVCAVCLALSIAAPGVAQDSLNVRRVGSLYHSWEYAYDVKVVGNYAYCATGLSGLSIVNISDPAAPTEVGFYDTPGYANGVAVSGNYAYVADSYYFVIYDCSAATGISGSSILPPSSFSLSCFPNPFNPVTTISFEVPRAERVRVEVYDVTGRLVRELMDERLMPGAHAVRFDGSSFSSGTYFCRLAAPDFSATRKMVLVK
jgi:hypothetical protein